MEDIGSLDHNTVVFAMLAGMILKCDVRGVQFLLKLFGSILLQLLLQVIAVLGPFLHRQRLARLVFR
jgi:hypothetical protein